jgi:hypothetical protein
VSHSSQRRPIHLALLAASGTAIAWGALAFGAVYPWAFTPLAIGCAAIGIAALIVERRGRPQIGALAIALAAIGLAIAVQLVPLSPATLARVSPQTDAFLRQYDLSYTAGLIGDPDREPTRAQPEPAHHPLSISAEKTVIGLALFAAFALFLAGTTRLVSALGARQIIGPFVIFGLVLAVVGIAQWTLTASQERPLVFGFWRPRDGSRAFGPFINPNHFAGWMLMALPLALAAFYDALVRTLHAAPSDGRDRMAILASPSMGSLLLFGLSCIVMGLSLIMTRSRSGLGALAVGSALFAWTVIRRQQTGAAKAAVLASFLLLLLGTAAWAGVDAVAGKFIADESLGSVGGRVSAWKDTVEIIRRFPLAGTGIDTYSVAMVLFQSGDRTLHFQEAHNDYLQLAAEGGLLVGLPVLGAVAIFIRDVRRRFREAPREGTTYWCRVGAVVGVISIALQSLVEFSLQMPGNAALFAVLAAIALHQSPSFRSASRSAFPFRH